VKRFRGGLVFKAHRPLYPSALGLRVIKKRRDTKDVVDARAEVVGAGPVENSNSHGARPVHLIIPMIKWIRTSRLSLENSLCRGTIPKTWSMHEQRS